MTHRSVAHATLVIEKTYSASPARVFEALRNPEARRKWGPPSDKMEIVFEETDFKVGGRDVSLCGLKGAAHFRVEARYCDIVEDRRIVFAETVEDGGARLGISLICFELFADGAATRLKLTDQVASLDGADVASNSQMGWGASLQNLEAYLAAVDGVAT